MANDNVLGRSGAGFGGGVSSSSATLSIGLNSGNIREGTMLVQNVGIQYSQNVTQIFELQSDKVYFANAKATGQANLGVIFGPTRAEAVLYGTLAQPCNGSNITYASEVGCNATGGGSGNRQKRVAHNFVLQQYGFNIAVGDMLVQEQMSGPIASVTIN